MNKTKVFAVAAIAAGSLFAGAASVSAQTIGFKVGPSFSKMDIGDETANDLMKNLTSVGGGGFLRFGMAGLAMQGELLATTKGFKFEDPDSDDNAELKLTYLEVPLLARFGLGTGTISPYVMVGPTFSYELSCSGSLTFFGETASGACDDDGEESFRKKFDVGATGVAGLEFAMGPGAILVEGRYNHGLRNLADDDSDPDFKMRHRSFALMAGYSFTMK